MLVKRTDFPEDSEIVLCTVTKIHYHSVFVKLDEYAGKQGMIHISEVSPGRIRNLSDFVQEGKKIVCKVLKINRDRGHIDLSLRRVSPIQKRTKIDGIKQEQKAEKILEFVGEKHGATALELFNKIEKIVFESFLTLHDCFQAVVDEEEPYNLKLLGLDKDTTETLEFVIRQRIKPPKVEISGEFCVISYAPNGVEIIKDSLTKVIESQELLDLHYKGGGKFIFKIIANDFKTAEKVLKESTDFVENYLEDYDAEFSFTREDGKKSKD